MILLKVYAKTIVAFLVGWIGNMVVNLVNGATPWPHNTAEWVQFLVTSLGVALGVSLTRNKITQDQLDKDPYVIGGTVVDKIPPIPPTSPTSPVEVENPWV